MTFTSAARAAALMLALLVASALLAAGCGDDDSNTDSSKAAATKRMVPEGTEPIKDASLIGYANARGPVSGATVRVTDLDGKQLGVSEEKSAADGSWLVVISKLPRDFRVEVEGGTDAGAPFAGKLLHTEHDYVEYDTIDVNPATTLAAQYIAEHPKATEDEAATAVRRYLGVSDTVDLTSELRYSNAQFNGSDFMESVPAGHKVHDHAKGLVAEIDAKKTSKFPTPPANDLSDITDPSANQAGEMASTVALAAFTGGPEGAEAAAGGIVISAIFGGGPSPELKMLEQISAQLTALSAQATDTEVAIADLAGKLDQTAYDERVADILPTTPSIDTLWKQYVAMTAPKSSDKTRAAALKSFRGAMNGRYGDKFDLLLDKYHLALAGGGGTNGALKDWNQAVLAPTERFRTQADQQRVPYALEYWTAYEVKLFLMSLAYAQDIDTDTGGHDPDIDYDADTLLEEFATPKTGNFDKQIAASGGVDKLTPMPDNTLYEMPSNLLWANKMQVPGVGRIQRQLDGRNLLTFLADANAKATAAKMIAGWDAPSLAQLQYLQTPQGGYGGPSSLDEVPNYLEGQGFDGVVGLPMHDYKEYMYTRTNNCGNMSTTGPRCTSTVMQLPGSKVYDDHCEYVPAGRCGVGPFASDNFFDQSVLMPVHAPTATEKFFPSVK